MQFTAMSVWVFTGLAVLTAGVLAALQYLRVNPRRTRVVTSLFWRQAVEQARARTLFERFRHPRTYLLLLAASLLVLLALAAPVRHAENKPRRVIALEAGLAMSAGDDRFENALALVRAEARSLDEERIAVVAADPQPRVLKRFDESLAVMMARLDCMKPADAPVIREDLLVAADSLLAGRENGGVVLVTAQPATVNDEKIRVLAAGENTDNAFILSVVFAPDSADPTRGTVHGRVGLTGKQAATVNTIISRGDDILSKQGIEIEPGGTKQFTVANIAADGAPLAVALDGNDAIAGDDRIIFQLPDRRRIQVVPVAGYELPPVLSSVLKGLPEVSIKTDGAGPLIRIGPAGSDAEIQIQASAAAGKWLSVRASDHHLVAGMEFEDAVCRAPGEASSAGIPLLLAGEFPLASLDSQERRLTVADSFFDTDSSIVRRTGYVVFWAAMFHHLAAWHDEPLTLSPMQGTRSTDPGADHLVMKAGFGNFDLAGDGVAATPDRSLARLPAWQWLLAAALAVMLVEAVLNLRGKII
jgi:hypothetical protein